MTYSLVYALHRFVFRVVDFFHHWFINGPRFIAHQFLSVLARFDQTFAVRLTIRHLFEPLYGDYSIPGHVFGIVFRTGRILIGSVLYLVIGAVFVAFLVAWLLVPLALLFLALTRCEDAGSFQVMFSLSCPGQ